MSGVDFYGIKKICKKKFQIGDYVLWFPKGEKTHMGNSRKDGLVHFGYNISYPIILFLFFLLTILNQTQY
jgi:hypothetical protein